MCEHVNTACVNTVCVWHVACVNMVCVACGVCEHGVCVECGICEPGMCEPGLCVECGVCEHGFCEECGVCGVFYLYTIAVASTVGTCVDLLCPVCSRCLRVLSKTRQRAGGVRLFDRLVDEAYLIVKSFLDRLAHQLRRGTPPSICSPRSSLLLGHEHHGPSDAG